MNGFKAAVALLALTAPALAHAGAETLAITLFAGVTVGTALTVAKFALILHGLYRARRARSKARRAANNAIDDRKFQAGASDMPKSTVYGECQVDGRVVFRVEAKSDQPGLAPGDEPKFYIVKELEPDHEIDRIVDLQFDGRPVGPFFGDPHSPMGAPVTEGSHYYRQTFGVDTVSGTLGPDNTISVPDRAITEIVSLTVSGGTLDAYESEHHVAVPVDQRSVALGIVLLSRNYSGREYVLTYRFAVNQAMVKAWFYRGTDDQQANQRIIDVSGGVWTVNARLRGQPYVVVEITPDLDLFPNMEPYITATVRGKRGLLVNGGSGFSRNPCDHIYDYLLTEIEARPDEINMPLLQAAWSACDEVIFTGYNDENVGRGEGPTDVLPDAVWEPRHSCDIVLSTEADMIDNLRYLLVAMAGQLVYSGGQCDIYAGVPEAPQGTLTDDDLGPGGIEIVPFSPMLESFNAVRGRHVGRTRIHDSLGGLTTGDEAYAYAVTDFPPYKSQRYIDEDGGRVNWEEIDLPGVRSAYQAQRISKLLLHLNRNARTLQAEWAMPAARYSAGQVVNVTLKAAGFLNHPFRIMSKEIDAERATVTMTMKEEPAAVYSFEYDEARDPDPAPNTILTPADQVEAPENLRITADVAVSRIGIDGSVLPIARVEWDQAANYGILRGGRVEVWYKFGQQMEWEKRLLPGDTTKIEIPVQRSLELAVQVRFINAVQVAGEFRTISKILSDVPTQYLTGNLLYNARFESFTQIQRPDANYHDFLHYLPGWFGIDGASPNGYRLQTGEGPVDVKPVPLPLRKPNPGRPGSSDTGIMTWSDFEASGYRAQYAQSQLVEVQGGAHVVAFAYGWAEFGEVSVSVALYDQAGDFMGERESARVVSSSGAGDSLDSMQLLRVFVRVPDFAGNRPSRIRLRLWYNRFASLPDNFVTVVKFARPYLGYASDGQVTLPPWTA